MSKPDLFPFGYGRTWSEPKATGIRRLVQIGREPATKTAYAVVLSATVLAAGILLVLLPR